MATQTLTPYFNNSSGYTLKFVTNDQGAARWQIDGRDLLHRWASKFRGK